MLQVTLSTVGYGDITPDEFGPQAVVMGMILCAVIVIPMQISSIIDQCAALPERGLSLPLTQFV